MSIAAAAEAAMIDELFEGELAVAATYAPPAGSAVAVRIVGALPDLLASMGRQERILVDDLPAARFSKRLFRLS